MTITTSRSTANTVSFPTGTLIVVKNGKLPIYRKSDILFEGMPIWSPLQKENEELTGMTDKSIYESYKVGFHFMSPYNKAGIAKHLKKHGGSKNPFYTELLLELQEVPVPEKVKKPKSLTSPVVVSEENEKGIVEKLIEAEEKINHIVAAPIQVILDNPKKRGNKKQAKKVVQTGSYEDSSNG